MIYSRDNVSIFSPKIIFIKQLLTPPFPRVCQHGAITFLSTLFLRKNNSDWRFDARHHSFRWSGGAMSLEDAGTLAYAISKYEKMQAHRISGKLAAMHEFSRLLNSTIYQRK